MPAGPALISSSSLFLSLFAVSFSLRYLYYPDRHLELGPNSSRLFAASSLFVQQIQVRDAARKGVLVYGFSQKPELSIQTNWTLSKFLFISPYHRQGFHLWQNKGSRIRLRWEVEPRTLSHLLLVNVIEGEHNFETVEPYSDTFDSAEGIKEEREYIADKDDNYYFGFTNLSPLSLSLKMKVDLSSKLYDTSNFTRNCSTINGLCKLELLFPSTRYVILSTASNGDGDTWYVMISFMGRLFTYAAVLVVSTVIVSLLLKCLGVFDSSDRAVEEVTESHVDSERDPLVPKKKKRSGYGTVEENSVCDVRNGSCNELYDGKICVICYEEERNCFIIPCGHCATCYECAQRIMEGENKVCPICRRFIHRVRRLISA